MDLCHCENPLPKPFGNGLTCEQCGMWYDEQEWKRDPRRLPKTIQKNKIGRNDFCPCGSGKKFKKCCLV